MFDVHFTRCNSAYRLWYWNSSNSIYCHSFLLLLYQHLPFTVLKHFLVRDFTNQVEVATAPTVYGIEIYCFHLSGGIPFLSCNRTYRLRYELHSVRQQRSKATMRLTHCKYQNEVRVKQRWCGNSAYCLRYWNLISAIPSSTIALTLQEHLSFTVLKPTKLSECDFTIFIGCNSTYCLRYWNWCGVTGVANHIVMLQQHLPFTVCAEGCEAAEEQSDDEVRTSQVPERSEGKTKLMR